MHKIIICIYVVPIALELHELATFLLLHTVFAAVLSHLSLWIVINI